MTVTHIVQVMYKCCIQGGRAFSLLQFLHDSIKFMDLRRLNIHNFYFSNQNLVVSGMEVMKSQKISPLIQQFSFTGLCKEHNKNLQKKCYSCLQ